MEHTAKLVRLPNGVQFPPELDGKITFDATRRCLIWRGFMTEDEFRRLLELHGDQDYQHAVAGLFEGCNRLETPLMRRLDIALAVLVAICLIGVVIVLVGVAFQKSPTKKDSQSRSGSPKHFISVTHFTGRIA